MDHDRRDASTPATRCTTGIMPVAASLSNAPTTATPSSVMSPQTRRNDPTSQEMKLKPRDTPIHNVLVVSRQ
jgi:hypothetical protein